MKTEDFLYSLPPDRIAQEPCASRDQSRMMVIERNVEKIKCLRFSDFPGFFGDGDVLVLNDSRVIPARLWGRKSTGGRVEMLLLGREDKGTRWQVMLRPGKRVEKGMRINLTNGAWGDVVQRIDEKKWIIDFHVQGEINSYLSSFGAAPLPPYIKRASADGLRRSDLERYQTIYASVPGSIAAPTAGLHFSEKVLEELKNRGVGIVYVTLHVGYGTFLPVEAEDVEDHVMEPERYRLSEEASESIREARRVIAVGTTSVRTIESAALKTGEVSPGEGETGLFIFPGFQFRATGGMLTNFHLPASSLFLLVCAFGGTDLMKRAYRMAIEKNFRFYSYGDCMLIL
ncbi:MAG: tRNA preQ1(34) S-adenosylmethionine ribosyltransferase-isomerase QueA [Syntrophales bacterium]|nr:tRNA preQ1(34) S-adenosylmethionine ribosyltransferase-isomerase QueA [Syntrophales bacterium]